MTGPLFVSGAGALVASLAVGVLFGFSLERAGFGSARKLTAAFYGRDLTVLKVMFTAIVTAMLGLQYLALLGVVDMQRVGILPTYLWPQAVGGLLFGIGFVLGGYCPGTALVALVSGKRDALVFLAGIMAGTAAFGVAYPWLRDVYVSGSAGALTLARGLGVTPGVAALIVTLVALGAFRLATLVEEALRSRDAPGREEEEAP